MKILSPRVLFRAPVEAALMIRPALFGLWSLVLDFFRSLGVVASLGNDGIDGILCVLKIFSESGSGRAGQVLERCAAACADHGLELHQVMSVVSLSQAMTTHNGASASPASSWARIATSSLEFNNPSGRLDVECSVCV